MSATATTSNVTLNTSLRQLRRAFPDLEEMLMKIGYAPVTGIITAMSNPSNLTLSNIARAAGLTEIEIVLLVEDLNERLTWKSSNKGRTTVRKKSKPKAKIKAGAKTKAKTKKQKRNTA